MVQNNQNNLVSSVLGNVSNDNTLSSILTHVADKNNADPLFRDTTNGDFHLNSGSPAHDIGVAS